MRVRYYLLLCALLLITCSAWAQAPGTYADATSTACTTTAATATITVTSGQLVVVWAGSDANGDTLSIADSATQSYTLVMSQSASGAVHRFAELAYKANSAALTNVSVTSTLGATCWVDVAAYSNMALSSPVDAHGIVYNTGSPSTCTSQAITTTNASDVILGLCLTNSGPQTFTAAITGTCSNTITLRGSTANTGLEDCNTTATGSFTSTMGISPSTNNIAGIAAFKQAAAACVPTLLLLGVGKC